MVKTEYAENPALQPDLLGGKGKRGKTARAYIVSKDK